MRTEEIDATVNRKVVSSQNARTRRDRLQSDEGLRVHAPSVVSKVRAGRRLCVASPSLSVYSETFIKAHIEQLPFDVLTLNGSKLDQSCGDSILKQSRLEKLRNYLNKRRGLFCPEGFVLAKQASWLKEERVDVLLAEYGTTGTRLVEACKQAEVPLVVHFHGFDAHSNETVVLLDESYQRMFEYAFAIVAVSRAMVERLVDLGAPREKVHYIPSFVDPEMFVRAKPTQASLSLLSVGRFVEKKAPHLSILAFERVLHDFPNATLELVGEGPLLGASVWLARALGIEKSVIFHGKKDHSWVATAMQRVRGFVQHSVEATSGDCEGTPVAVLEAQCCGVPVVATSHTGIVDVVVSGETGFLSKEGDIDGMADGLRNVLGMKQAELEQMSVAASDRITSKFSRDETINKLAGLVRSI